MGRSLTVAARCVVKLRGTSKRVTDTQRGMYCTVPERAGGMTELVSRQSGTSWATGLVVCVALAIVLAGYALLAPQTAHQDDKDWSHLWLGGRMVASGNASELYNPERQVAVFRQAHAEGKPPPVWEERNRMFGCFNYPPPAALAYAGVAWLPMGTAAVVHAYLSIAVALVAAWLLARAVGRPVLGAVLSLAVLAHPAFFVNLSLGQNAVFTMAVVLVAWCLCERGRELAAGLILGLLICKPNWLFAVGWIPLVHGRWRVLAGMAIGAAGAVAVTALVLGVQPFVDYYSVLRRVASLQDAPGYYLDVKYSALGLFRKWFGVGRAADLLGWSSCAAVVLVTWRVTRGCWRPGSPSFRRAIACCLVACLWVNPHLNYYDLLLIGPCAACVLLDWASLRSRGRIAAWIVLAFAYVAIPWDESWAWRRAFPAPSFAILVLWGWFVAQLAAPGKLFSTLSSTVTPPRGAVERGLAQG